MAQKLSILSKNVYLVVYLLNMKFGVDSIYIDGFMTSYMSKNDAKCAKHEVFVDRY